MDSRQDPARAGGCPIRTSLDHSLLAAPQGFSQRATSFIASWRQGIHQMPFSCSPHASPAVRQKRASPAVRQKRWPPAQRQCAPHKEPQAKPLSKYTHTYAHTHTHIAYSHTHSGPHRMRWEPFDAPGTPPPGPILALALKAHARTAVRPTARPGTTEAPQPRFTNAKDHHALRSHTHRCRNKLFDHRSVTLETPLLETTGIEPVTPCLQSRCSPS